MYIVYELNSDHKVNQMVRNASVYFEKEHLLHQKPFIAIWKNISVVKLSKDRVNDFQKHAKYVLKRKKYFST
jgi:hypothetical protein